MGILGDIIDDIFFNEENEEDEKDFYSSLVEKDNDDSDGQESGELVDEIEEDGDGISVSGGQMYDWYNHSSDISNSGLIKQIEKQIAQGKINTAISLYEIYREHVLLFDQSNPKNVTDAVANYLIGNAYLEIEDDLESARNYITKAYSLYDSSYPFFWHCLYDMYLLNKHDGNTSEARKYILAAYQYVEDSDKLRIGKNEVLAEKQILEEFNVIDDEYTISYLNNPYKDRKILLIVDGYISLFYDNFSILSIDNDLSQLSFPVGHPKVNELYVAHPLSTNRYMPIESYQLELIEDRVREFCELVQSLGATEISIECLNSNSKDSTNSGNRNLSGGVSKRSSVYGSGHNEYSRRLIEEISQSINLHQTFQPHKVPTLPDNLVWYNGEPSWQRLYRQRMEGVLTHKERIETKKSQMVDNREMKEIKGEIETLFANMDVAFDKTEEAKFEQQENAVLAISVKFAPLSQLTGETSSQQTAMNTANEQKYIDEVKECLADGEKTKTGRRLLNMQREWLGISEARATELEASVSTPQLSDEEKEYLEAYREACEDGQLSDKERRMLNRLRDMLGITEERAKEIEKIKV